MLARLRIMRLHMMRANARISPGSLRLLSGYLIGILHYFWAFSPIALHRC
jgi:hypothetical protein